MGERRPYTLVLSLMLCVFFMFMFEGNVMMDDYVAGTNCIGLNVRQT